MASISSLTALHPGLAKLRQQLEGVLPDRAADAPAAKGAMSSPILQQVMDNAPLLIEAGRHLIGLLRRAPAGMVQEVAAVMPAAAPRRMGLLRPLLIGAAVLGIGYILTRAVQSTDRTRAVRRG